MNTSKISPLHTFFSTCKKNIYNLWDCIADVESYFNILARTRLAVAKDIHNSIQSMFFTHKESMTGTVAALKTVEHDKAKWFSVCLLSLEEYCFQQMINGKLKGHSPKRLELQQSDLRQVQIIPKPAAILAKNFNVLLAAATPSKLTSMMANIKKFEYLQ